jgi:hypothetical protein
MDRVAFPALPPSQRATHQEHCGSGTQDPHLSPCPFPCLLGLRYLMPETAGLPRKCSPTSAITSSMPPTEATFGECSPTAPELSSLQVE